MDHRWGTTNAAHPALDEVSAAVDRLVEDLAAGGVRDISHAELSQLVAQLRGEQARLEAVALAAVGEVDARGSHAHEGALTTGAWLRMRTRVTAGEATATVRTARVLRAGVLPETARALAQGAITPRHAQVIAAGVAHAPPGAAGLIEPHAVAAAREADVGAVAGVLRQFQHALDAERAEEAALRRYERRGFTIVATLDGSMAISGTADEESGAVIATAVDAASPLVAGDTRSAAQRRLDGLRELCARFLASPDTPRQGGGRPHVIVTTDRATLRGTPPPVESPSPGETLSPGAMLSWVGHVTGSTARRIACDAAVTTVTIGPDGEVTDTRTDRRFFTAAQRRAMIARDGDRCFWPWCDRPVAWSHGHHLDSWAHGGPTTVANGVLPCEGHHVMTHEGHWTPTRLPDGRYQVRHPDGRTIGPEPHPPGHNRPPPHRRE